MPSLVFEHSGSRRGGSINGRVLIGRKLTQGVVISDPTVSRLHAWIDNREGAFVLTDAGSRTGTFVNGEAIVRWELQHGDEIQIGPVSLKFQEDAEPPPDVEVLNLSAGGASIQSSKTGILFDCQCGAPLWVGREFAGKRGLCKYCGEPITVPQIEVPKPPKKIRPVAPVKASVKCGVCHSAVDAGEEMTACPDCGTTFHTDCWHENYGCSSYGCAQVNTLKPPEVEAETAQEEAPLADDAAPQTPWDLLLLAASVVGSLIGSLLFGMPAMLVAIASLARFVRGKNKRGGILFGALALSILGIAGGLALSDWFWFNVRHLAMLQR